MKGHPFLSAVVVLLAAPPVLALVLDKVNAAGMDPLDPHSEVPLTRNQAISATLGVAGAIYAYARFK